VHNKTAATWPTQRRCKALLERRNAPSARIAIERDLTSESFIPISPAADPESSAGSTAPPTAPPTQPKHA
jgi:hypothetical protein